MSVRGDRQLSCWSNLQSRNLPYSPTAPQTSSSATIHTMPVRSQMSQCWLIW